MMQFGETLLLLFASAATVAAPTQIPAEAGRAGPDRPVEDPPGQAPRVVEGYVDLQCTVTSTGTMANCKVLNETPKGYGFADAALKMSTFFKTEVGLAGRRPIAGSVWTQRVRFKIPKRPSVELGPSGPTSDPR